MQDLNREAVHAIVNTCRNLADTLESILARETSTEPAMPPTLPRLEAGKVAPSDGGDNVWDPEFDVPLVTPKPNGTRQERDWCSVTYLGAIYAINKRHNRGADKDEIRVNAQKAGYRDGRAVTAWSKGNGGTQNDEDGQRWITADGVLWVKGFAEKLGIRLPEDLKEDWAAPRFSS